ncbi:MAG: hypothetical protein EBZ50_13035 [Alphaproteobacteria bacterium]|nr:hypothetical protein [Alphaproteobacteria bacterium]
MFRIEVGFHGLKLRGISYLKAAKLECRKSRRLHSIKRENTLSNERTTVLCRLRPKLLLISRQRSAGRRRTPGRPLTYATTDAFLAHFSLTSLDALPGKDDLKALGAIDARAARELDVPRPSDAPAADEDGLHPGDGEGAFYVDHMADPAD